MDDVPMWVLSGAAGPANEVRRPGWRVSETHFCFPGGSPCDFHPLSFLFPTFFFFFGWCFHFFLVIPPGYFRFVFCLLPLLHATSLDACR